MANSASSIIEVRPDGNDTNGGAFVVGSTGTDWSQQASPQYAVTDGVSAGTTTLTSITASFGTDVVGNWVYVAGGTGSIVADWYQIISRTNAATIVVDRTTGLTAGTGVTLRIGGAWKTLANLKTSTVPGQIKVFCKAVSTLQTAVGFSLPSGGSARIIGYTSTRGDGGQFTIQLITNTGLTGLTLVGGWMLENLTIDANGLGTSTCFSGGASSAMRNCVAKNFTSVGISGMSGNIEFCEVTGGTSTASAAINNSGSVNNCYVHDNACTGILITTGNAQFNKVINNTGATSDGIQCPLATNLVYGNTVYNSGRDGIRFTATALAGTVKNNLLHSNAGYGIRSASAIAANPRWDGNCFYNNTLGTRNNIDSTTGVAGVGAYTNVLDVALSNDPCVNAAGGNFALNNTAAAGAAARATGQPTSWLNSSEVGYPDFGAIQSQPTVGTVPSIANQNGNYQ